MQEHLRSIYLYAVPKKEDGTVVERNEKPEVIRAIGLPCPYTSYP